MPSAAMAVVSAHQDPAMLPVLGQLADLVEGVVTHLETTSDQPLPGAVAECNAVLETCLEARREAPNRGSTVAARDELRRLARLLQGVEPPASVALPRQQRRDLR